MLNKVKMYNFCATIRNMEDNFEHQVYETLVLNDEPLLESHYEQMLNIFKKEYELGEFKVISIRVYTTSTCYIPEH